MGIVSGALLGLFVLTVVLAPQRWGALALLAAAFFLTQGHAIQVGELSLFPIRIVGAAAAGRVLARRELRLRDLNTIDVTVVLLYVYTAAVWMIRTSSVAGQQLASAADPVLCYLAFRGLMPRLDELRWALSAFAGLLVPYTLAVAMERVTGQSSFVLVGASNDLLFREGIARCQGSFRHAILLGSVASSLFSLYVGLYLGGGHRLRAGMGILLSAALVVLSNSGGPVTSFVAGLLVWVLWPMRHRLHHVKVAVVLVLIALALFMKAPIWYLPFKVSGVVGGGGYHRGLLMERAWEHLDEWWLAGMEMEMTANWFPYVLDAVGGADVTNQFLAFGLRAGLPALALFVLVLWLSFRSAGRAFRSLAKQGGLRRADVLLAWGAAGAVVVHVVSWLGVSYFDQSHWIWLMHAAVLSGPLAAAGSLSADTSGSGLGLQSARRHSRAGAVRQFTHAIGT